METAEILVLLLTSIAVLALIAQRVAVPYPIVLVVGGLVIGLIPGLPAVRLDPDVVLLLFLPPLLFSQALSMSWHDFWRFRRPIFLLAVGAVLITATAVAFAAHALFGLPLPAGFVLGAVVSPPDAVAASAIAQRLALPRRVVTILEGESLVNDATGLVAYKFAISAVVMGGFSIGQAAFRFVAGATGGVAIGLAVAFVAGAVLARVKEYSVLITASLLVPYVSYLSAEHVGASGVLAAVAAGLRVGWRGLRTLSPTTRIQAAGFWSTLVFLLNSMIFLLIGLQLPAVWAGLGGRSTADLLWQAAAILLVVVVVRMLWVFPGAYVPRWLSRTVRGSEPKPGWRLVTIVGWSGMRGVVSLAAAMALPLATANGSPFPGRDSIVFLTFSVILGTLVLQGLTLEPLIRALGIQHDPLEDGVEPAVRLQLAKAAEQRLTELSRDDQVSATAVRSTLAKYEERIAILRAGGKPGNGDDLAARRRLRREAIASERLKLFELRERGEVPEELLQRILRELDLDDERLV